jgi:hypothetical protein
MYHIGLTTAKPTSPIRIAFYDIWFLAFDVHRIRARGFLKEKGIWPVTVRISFVSVGFSYWN